MPTYLDELLTERAESVPQSDFLEHEMRPWTYAQVEILADRGAQCLIDVGVVPGDRVVILGDNSDGFVVAMLAVLRAGAIFVPVSPRVADAMLAVILRMSTPKVVLGEANLMASYAHLLGNTLCREFSELLADREVGRAVRVNRRTDIACIIFTSGSTGLAQGVACTHSAILMIIRLINSVLEQRAEDRILCVLPFSFDYSLYQVFLAMDCGATVVIAATTTTASNLPRILAARSITVLPLVPALALLLLRSRMLERLQLPELRLVTNTGDLLPTSQQMRLRQLLTNTVIIPMYGLTECKRVAILPPNYERKAPTGTVGFALPGTTVRLRPLQGASAACTEWGELLIQGEHLMDGYWGNSEATRRRFQTDLVSGVRTLHSGDVFSRDQNGFLTFLGRVESLGHWRGNWLFPAPLEDALASLPGVDQAALVTTRNGAEIQGITAFLSTLCNDATLESEAHSMIAEKFGVPANIKVHCLPKFPYTINGKVDRPALVQSVMRGIES